MSATHNITASIVTKLTEVDIGFASASAANPGGSGDRAALLEGDELVEVVEIGEHLNKQNHQAALNNPD
jgi:hypothetical protein